MFRRLLAKHRSRPATAPHPGGTADPPDASPLIDVRDLRKRVSVEEFNRRAEEYFRRLPSADYQLAKPFASVDEAPELLICFGQLLAGLQLAPGMTVLDFGAGTCWASRCLSQMGMNAIAVDASATALRVGEELYRRNPVFGVKPAPRFLCHDGRNLDLPDESVDRVVCVDAFHHVPNPERMLAELGRVLVAGGIAGFSEPGPTHSRQPQSQYEMRTHGVLENDVEMEEIWSWAKAAGFSALRLALFSAAPHHVSLAEFGEYLDGSAGDRVPGLFHQAQASYLRMHRLFFLQKAGEAQIDSRQRAGLRALLELSAPARTLRAGQSLEVRGAITNTGTARWLPANAPVGAVKLGSHLLNGEGTLLDLDHSRHDLTPAPGRVVHPGERIPIACAIALPEARGDYLLEIDLVSEGVSWFAQSGTEPVRMAVSRV